MRQREGPAAAIVDLLRQELIALIIALPERLKESLPEHLREDTLRKDDEDGTPT